jgi:PAS domain S-box-containing protein
MTTYLIVALVILVVNGDRQRLTETLKALNQQLQEQVAQQADELDEAQAELAKTALSLTEAIPIGTYTMVLHPNETMAHFSFMSEKFLQICGLDQEEAAADPLNIFACVHPDDYDGFLALNTETFARKIPFCEETRLIVAGEVRWIRAESVPRDLPDGSTVWEGVLADITETKRYEQQLQQANAEITTLNQDLEDRVKERTAELEKSRAQFQRLVDDIGSNFVLFSHSGLDGIVSYVSGGFESVFGLAKAQVLNHCWAESVQWLPEDAERTQMALLRILDERIQQFEMRFIHPTGELRTINVLQHAVKDENDQLIAVEGIIENITEQKQRIIQLAASESKFRTFIETANDLIFSINSTGCFTYLSPNTMDTLGYSPNELQGVAYAEIVHPDD